MEPTHARCGGTWRIPPGGGPTTCDGCGMELHPDAPRRPELAEKEAHPADCTGCAR